MLGGKAQQASSEDQALGASAFDPGSLGVMEVPHSPPHSSEKPWAVTASLWWAWRHKPGAGPAAARRPTGRVHTHLAR